MRCCHFLEAETQLEAIHLPGDQAGEIRGCGRGFGQSSKRRKLAGKCAVPNEGQRGLQAEVIFERLFEKLLTAERGRKLAEFAE